MEPSSNLLHVKTDIGVPCAKEGSYHRRMVGGTETLVPNSHPLPSVAAKSFNKTYAFVKKTTFHKTIFKRALLPKFKNGSI